MRLDESPGCGSGSVPRYQGISEVKQRRDENARHPPRARASVKLNLELFDTIRSWFRVHIIGLDVRSDSDGKINTLYDAPVEGKILG